MKKMTVMEAANAVINGGVEGVTVGSHDFNLKAVQRGWEGNVYVIRGRISHRLTGLPDDQFDYSIKTRLNPNNVDFDEKIDFGGFTSIIAPVLGGAAGGLAPFPMSLFAQKITTMVLEGIGNAIEMEIKGKGWQKVAQGIVATVYATLIEDVKTSNPPPVGSVSHGGHHSSSGGKHGGRVQEK
jgi:hypothetical protein